MATVVKPKSKPKLVRSHRLNAKEAVTTALQYFHDLFSDLPKPNMMLEEIEQSKDGKYWFITLGYNVPDVGSVPAMLRGVTRTYKLFTIDQATGQVVSVKMRRV